MLTKPEIRSDVIAKCKLLDESYRQKAFREIPPYAAKLVENANNIAIYHAYGFEFDLSGLIQLSHSLHKTLYQPIAYKESKIMRFARVVNSKVNPKIFYAKDDEIGDETPWYNIDLIFLPLIAVSLNGYRLGKGGGYYDATFANGRISSTSRSFKKQILCGVGFDLQVVDELPIEPWDIKLDYFVSEKRTLEF